ncbi:hypothetical protein [Methanoculleus chikugoensis]|uniref:hypothetical protein n=1 Tax=Methanoculleus chikugoensis TaxID=118126 RepID=UPI001FB32DCC|nr:hypothetical protein [Methanoculleus chikugoensis]
MGDTPDLRLRPWVLPDGVHRLPGGLAALSKVAVPAMLLLIAISGAVALRSADGIDGLLMTGSAGTLTVAEALTIVVGTFVAGGTRSPTGRGLPDRPGPPSALRSSPSSSGTG